MTSVHLSNAHHPTSGGIRTFYTALLEEANRAGRRVALIVPGTSTYVEDVGRIGRIYRVAAPTAPAFDRRYRIMLPYQYVPGGAGRTLIDIREREQPDLVEICDKYSLPYLAAMLRKRWYPSVQRPALVGLSCERFDDNATDANAWLTPPDAFAFASAVRAAHRGDPRRVTEAMQTARRFGIRAARRRYFELYDESAAGSRPCHGGMSLARSARRAVRLSHARWAVMSHSELPAAYGLITTEISPLPPLPVTMSVFPSPFKSPSLIRSAARSVDRRQRRAEPAHSWPPLRR